MNEKQKRRLINSAVTITILTLSVLILAPLYINVAEVFVVSGHPTILHIPQNSFTHDFPWAGAAIVISLVISITVIPLNRKQIPIRLSDTEQRSKTAPHIEFPNRFPWAMSIGLTAFMVCMAALLYTPVFRLFLMDANKEEIMDYVFFMLKNGGWIAFVALIAVIVLFNVLLAAPMRNRYIIDRDTLWVYEYRFGKLTTELRIPLDTIRAVCLKSYFSYSPQVVLQIDGLCRTLHCNTRPEELAYAICQRLLHN